MPPRRYKVIVMIGSGGGGHMATGRALRDACQVRLRCNALLRRAKTSCVVVPLLLGLLGGKDQL